MVSYEASPSREIKFRPSGLRQGFALWENRVGSHPSIATQKRPLRASLFMAESSTHNYIPHDESDVASAYPDRVSAARPNAR